MNEELIRAMPAIIAASAEHMGRVRATGEVCVDGAAIRIAAPQAGYAAHIKRHELAVAMVVCGAVGHSNGICGKRYKFPEAYAPADAVRMATDHVLNLL